MIEKIEKKITIVVKKVIFIFLKNMYHNRLSLLKLSQVKSELSFATIQNSIGQCKKGGDKFHLILFKFVFDQWKITDNFQFV